MRKHHGETEAAMNYRFGWLTGSDDAQEQPRGVLLADQLARHMASLTTGIRLEAFELDYRAGYSTGWLMSREH